MLGNPGNMYGSRPPRLDGEPRFSPLQRGAAAVFVVGALAAVGHETGSIKPVGYGIVNLVDWYGGAASDAASGVGARAMEIVNGTTEQQVVRDMSQPGGEPSNSETSPGSAARPFSADSLWNTPLPANVSWRDEPKLRSADWYINRGEYSIPVVRSQPSDPLVATKVPESWGHPEATLELHVPEGVTGADGNDGTIVIISDDIAYNFWRFERTSDTEASATAYAYDSIVSGTGWGRKEGSMNVGAGIRAAGANALAGLLVDSHFEDAPIDHALSVSLTDDILQHGYVEPAISEDNGATYTGSVPMGSRLGIPPDTPRPENLSEVGNKVWDSMTQYGAFVTDRHSGDAPVILYADPFSVTKEHLEPLKPDLDTIMAEVRVVE